MPDLPSEPGLARDDQTDAQRRSPPIPCAQPLPSRRSPLEAAHKQGEDRDRVKEATSGNDDLRGFLDGMS